ncbi:hypothetical protein [Staphylococcus ratti]|uniref:Uncharacterized protein n=1 Tax=Staphylococcus ratti TaxID=2892440 RepID=A0ABY3PC09_9STAP|nr:hypothetical protein [Staphylococcus ratti]UEX89857.1 hypothetical protein LN051_09875 [Staphylococcus ratti]
MKKSFVVFISSSIVLLIIILSVTIYLVIQLNRSDINTTTAALTPSPSLKGIVQSDYNYILKFDPNLGYIQDFHVKDNDKVAIETPLFTYYNPSKVPKINALNALLATKLSPEQTYQLNREILKYKADMYHTVQSPIKGIVRLHESVPDHNKEKILEITSEEQHILVKVPENLYTKFKKTQTVTLRSPFDNKTAKGTVISRYSTPVEPPNIDRKSFYFVKIKTTKNHPLGTHFDIHFSEPLLILPSDILLEENSVLIYKNGKLIKRIISYDKINEQLIIKDGIFVGEKVVQYPNEQKLKITALEK